MSEDAWRQFWAEEQRGGPGGCLPSQAIDSVQRSVWGEYAALLPRYARVVDLATGDGRVMGWLKEARPDLKLTGYDLAPRLPAPPRGTRSTGGVDMARLPDRAASVDAITSQFGVEYGSLAAVAGEIARVLKPGGLVGLMTHRADGPILAHNRARREGIRWVLDDRLLDKAEASLALRGLGLGVPPLLVEAPARAREHFGERSGAWELAEAISQTMQMGLGDRPDAVRTLLATLRRKALNEIARIDSLEQACVAVADHAGVAALLDAAGLTLRDRRSIGATNRHSAFADFWQFERR